jgi:hypothetical protein
MNDRRCMNCGEEIPENTSEIYDPRAINPRFGEPNQGFYLERCIKCASNDYHDTNE